MTKQLSDNAVYFATAMKHLLDKRGSGALKELANKTGKSEGTRGSSVQVRYRPPKSRGYEM